MVSWFWKKQTVGRLSFDAALSDMVQENEVLVKNFSLWIQFQEYLSEQKSHRLCKAIRILCLQVTNRNIDWVFWELATGLTKSGQGDAIVYYVYMCLD